jgi:hypothetical protein
MEPVEMLLAEGKQYARLCTLLELADECAVALSEHEVSHELTLTIAACYQKLSMLDGAVRAELDGHQG